MSEVVQRASEAAAKIGELQKERVELEAAANDHESQARTARARMFACKKEIAEWTTALNSLQVRQQVESAQQAATKAQAVAEDAAKKQTAALADVEKIKADLAAELEKAKAANAEIEKLKAAPPA